MKIIPADPGWIACRPRQSGNDELIESPVTHWRVDDGKLSPHFPNAIVQPVIAAVRSAGGNRYYLLPLFAEVEFEGLANRLRGMIDDKHIAAGRIR